MTIRALSFLFPVVVVAAAIFAQQTASVDPESAAAGAAGATPPAAGEGGQAILMQYVESRTTSITVKWTVNSTSSTSSSHHDLFQVLALSLHSGIVLVARPTNETEFTLTDLTVDTPYKVCVVAAKPSRSSVAALGVLEDSSDPDDDDDQHHRSCLLASTIPYVRLDSVLVFLGVVAFIALLILAAVICWKRSTHSEDPGSAAATDEDIDDGHTAPGTAGDPGFEEKKGLDEEQPLLDSDNNQYPPQKNSEQPVPEVKVESEVEPVVVSDHHHHEKSELPADGQADKPIPV